MEQTVTEEARPTYYEESDISFSGMWINKLAKIIYERNVKAGWWHNIKTGEPIPLDETQALVKMALIHSEISEATEGFRKNLMDDKLPHRKMAEVELADAIIRALDVCGAYGFDIGGAISEKLAYNASRADHKIENRLKGDGKKL